ncbi:hypothetical protein [Pseudomonas sp. F8002]|uniref:hypothetical protein n=1 Tax=Pseudomonas sp. F8002 TaxID=2738822 RepID=UPI00210B1157|nr:hypothetical protein [Pseudomonas sp. F8002]
MNITRSRPTTVNIPPVNTGPVTRNGGAHPPVIRTGSQGSPHAPKGPQNKPTLGKNPGTEKRPTQPKSEKTNTFQTLTQQKLMNQTPANRPFKPQVSAEPKSMEQVTQNLMVADRLFKAGVFKTQSGPATVTRDAFISAGVTGLVSAPFSIGTYAGSVWSGEKIKAQFTNNTPMLPPAHQPAPSTQVPAAKTDGTTSVDAGQDSDAGTTTARLSLAELRIDVIANTMVAMREGTSAPALQMSDTSSDTPSKRLKTLEDLYKAAEEQLKKMADENSMVFRPYIATTADGTDDKGRLDVIDKKFEAIIKFIGKLLHMKTLELPAESAETKVV